MMTFPEIPHRALLSFLTPRERDVFDAVRAGHTTAAIALLLRIHPRRVSIHRRTIRSKLRARGYM